MSIEHKTYQSPFTWRYGSEAMRQLWSETHRRRLMRRVWVALATAQHRAGLVTAEQLADLRAHEAEVDIERAAEIEAEIHHDVMAEVRTYAEQCPVGGAIIHLGATSADITDNVDALRIRQALDLILTSLRDLLLDLASQIERYANQPCMAFTHIQPAEPTTVGYRLAIYGQDLLQDYLALQQVRDEVHGKGFKGAVGTAASYTQLLQGTDVTPAQLEAWVMEELDLPAFPIATQTYPRKQDWRVISALAGLAASLHKLAFDLRILQTPPIGEWQEPFGKRQVGSSAMPFKRNPIRAEKIDSLARYLAGLAHTAWENAALSLLERTLDDSANRRIILPNAFLAADEILHTAHHIIRELRIVPEAIARTLERFGVFAATERLLMELTRAGADRQEMHHLIRDHAMAAWAATEAGEPNPLIERLAQDSQVLRYLPADRVQALLRAEDYVGDAPQRALALAQTIRATLDNAT